MNQTEAKDTAKILLDTEFNELNHNHQDFCSSMGWDADSASTKRAVKKAGVFCADADDILKLTFIIVDLVMDDNSLNSEDIANNSKVSDFVTNCVAEHINRNKSN
jgi:hypothetical protein